jgi:cytochrome c oxidase assembly protein subunit 15
MTPRAYARVTWALLAFLLAVVVWGAFVRATGSGAGCGAHWPVCNGELLPRAPTLETVIEFTHRVSSGLTTALVLAWVVLAFRLFPRGHRVRWSATLGGVAMLIEGAIGAALVLLHLVERNDSPARAVVMSLHLVNTFFLLGVVLLTSLWAAGVARPQPRGQGAVGALLGLSIAALVILGISGGIAALGDTLFPARSLAEGFRQDLSPSAHVLLRLRILHPVLAVISATLVLATAVVVSLLRPSPGVRRGALWVGALVVVQLVAGLVNLVLLAPVPMQLLHLLLADLVLLAVVLLAARALAEDAPRLAVASLPAVDSASLRAR